MDEKYIFSLVGIVLGSSGVTVGYDGLTYILPIDSKDIYQEDLNDRN
jgi:hypothetical protein